MTKRKGENRTFRDRWETEYMFTYLKDRPVCLVCGANVSVPKEYNLRRHYETKHQDMYKDLDTTQRSQKVEETKRGLVSQQNMFKKATAQNEATVKASYIVAEEIAKSTRSFNEGEFIKKIMLKVCDQVCPEKKQAFSNVSLSRNTIAERICDLATNLHDQLMEKGKDFVSFSLAVDESTDASDTAQLSVFIRGVDSKMCVTEELLGFKSMHGTTTGTDIFEEVCKCVTEINLPWDKLVGLTTDGAPAMSGKKNGLVGRMREKMQEENCAGELSVYHCIIHQESLCAKALKMEHVMTTVTQVVNFIRAKGLNHREFKSFLEEFGSEHTDVPYHTEVRWLSRGKVLNRFFELREEICQFLQSKGKDTAELQEQKFMCELAFLSDIASHLDALNLQLQGRGRIITEMYSSVKAFKAKLCLWENQLLQGNLGHFPCCQTINTQISTAVCAQFAEKLSVLGAEFNRRFGDFDGQKWRFELLSNPFAVDVEKAPTNIQMELIELQCDDTLKSKYDAVGAAQFPQHIPDTMPQLRTQAAQLLSMFGSTYLCEQLFSSMKMTKTSHRARLTDEHLRSIMKVASAQSLSPDTDELASKKRCQVSGLNTPC
ncbi:general transcription factor II-I repeat domain-containing protein 2-like [Erpetoichthys calabaricus]|uniref:general transcription factor II-I repeat domain-containing protein 2-like n=1 Tax=Erpetoichthys calabaricus TaxID=27687 RepID=UPI00109F9835|nr:general transcription factor II-I repeat domain-containing protein 2-like [Erpetoichthys calabaricus]